MADSPDGSWAVSEVSPGIWAYRASALGSCPAALMAERVGITPALSVYNPLKKAFARGNQAQGLVEEELVGKGWQISDQEKEVRLNVVPGVFVSGHIDCIGVNPYDFPMILEIKSFGESNLGKWSKYPGGGLEAFPKYAWQLSVYQWALAKNGVPMPGMMVIKPANGGELRSKMYETPVFSLGAIKARVLKIERAAKEKRVLECDKPLMYPCPYVFLHEDEESDKPEVVEDPVLDRLAQGYDEARMMEKAGKEAKAEILEKIVEHLHGRVKVDTVSWSVGSVNGNRTTYDPGKLEAEYPKVAEAVRKITPYVSPSIKRRKGNP